jgi:CHRD domain-containing protein
MLLPLLLLTTLGMLVALPHLAAADDQGQNEGAHHHTDDETNHEGLTIRFHIRLTGDQQVPAVNTTAFGFAEVQLSEDNNTLSFEVVVCNIANVIASHIHVGAAGSNGPVVLPFFGSSTPFNSTRGCDTLAEGTRTSANLVARPDAGINTWTDFINALAAGNTYVNVHTTAHTGGEIRGQLVHEQDDENEQVETTDN